MARQRWSRDRLLRLVVVLLLLNGGANAQSGRCVMEGFVVGESDNPGISGATVELTGNPESGGHLPKQTATTDAMGKYLLEDIPHGEYILRVTAQGYDTYMIDIYMLSDTTTQLHIKLKKHSSGRSR